MIRDLPYPFNPEQLTFFSRANENIFNVTEAYDGSAKRFSFGFSCDRAEARESRAVAVIEELQEFVLETNSMLWRVAEIDVERQNQWVVFSRIQNDLSVEKLTDFLDDSKNFLEHLRDEGKRLNLNCN